MNNWLADTDVSMPVPPRDDQPVILDLGGGFGFTTGGLVHNITQTQRDLLMLPAFAPEGF